MRVPYETDPTVKRATLVEVARHFSGSKLNPLVLMSDPERTPDLISLTRKMPSGSALIYRHFGQPGLETELRQITADRDVQLLIGQDPKLAERSGADGIHFSRRTNGEVVQQWRKTHPDWIISAAAWKTHPDPRPLGALDALFISSVFASSSPSAGTPIGVHALNRLSAFYDVPVFALGGIRAETAVKLTDSGIAGIAAIDGLSRELRTQERIQGMTDAIIAKPDNHISITKTEDGDRMRFEAILSRERATGELTLRKISDRLWNAHHTGVPSEIGGRGVGKALVKALVEDARAQGYRVVPGCPFIAKLFERKPDWAEGVAA